MHDKLFKRPVVLARYRAGPYAESREHFLKQARTEGYSLSTLVRTARVLLIVAEAIQVHGVRVSSKQLKSLLVRHIRKRKGRELTQRRASLLLRYGEDWLASMGTLLPPADRPLRFAQELHAFMEYMRVERGLSPVTIATREKQMRWFFASLPSRLRTLGEVTLGQIDAFLQSQARKGWSRSSLHALGSSLRSFFRYAALRGGAGPILHSASNCHVSMHLRTFRVRQPGMRLSSSSKGLRPARTPSRSVTTQSSCCLSTMASAAGKSSD